VFSWKAGLIAMGTIVASGAVQSCLEWQRRKTFAALVSSATSDIKIEQEDGLGSRTMRVTVGAGAKQGPPSRTPKGAGR
jgi:hypothetical protein